MAEQTTKAGAEDRRPARTEEVWFALGPFTRLGRIGLWVAASGVAGWATFVAYEVKRFVDIVAEVVQVYKLRGH